MSFWVEKNSGLKSQATPFLEFPSPRACCAHAVLSLGCRAGELVSWSGWVQSLKQRKQTTGFGKAWASSTQAIWPEPINLCDCPFPYHKLCVIKYVVNALLLGRYEIIYGRLWPTKLSTKFQFTFSCICVGIISSPQYDLPKTCKFSSLSSTLSNFHLV